MERLYFPPTMTFTLVLCVTVYSFLLICLYWRNNVVLYDTHSKAQPLLIILIFIHILFPFEAGDFYHYMLDLYFRHLTIEPIYEKIAKLVGYNYILFRLVVWGTAFLLFLRTVKRFELDKYKTAFLLYAMFIGVFDYARVSLAMSMYFLGLSYICYPRNNNKSLSYIWGLILIGTSYLFHTSIVLAIVMTIMIFVPINKRNIYVILLIFAISTPVLINLFDTIISSAVGGESRLDDKIISYSGQITEADSFSRFEWIRRIVQYATFFIPIIVLAPKLFNNGIHTKLHKGMMKLYKVTLGIQLVAVSTLMVGMSSFIIFYRFLYMSMIPVTILLSYGRQQGLVSPRMYKSLIIFALIGIFFGYSKMLLGGNLQM